MSKSKSIKSRISLIYISLVCVIGVLGVVSLYSLHNINMSVASLITTNYNSIERLATMEKSLNDQRKDILIYIYNDEKEKHLLSIQESYADFIEAYDAEYQTIIIREEMKMIVDIMTDYTEFNESLNGIKKIVRTEGYSLQEAFKYYEEFVVPKYIKTLEALDTLRVSNEEALFARRDEASDIVQNATYVLCVAFLLAAGLSFVTFRYYMNRLFRPIYEITQSLKCVGQGSMNRKASIQNTDELGSLCNEFNNMTQRLTEFEQSTVGSLMEEKNKTYSIVRSITEPMLILDCDFRITLMNSSFEILFGTTLGHSQGKHFLELMAESSFSEALKKIHYKANRYCENVIKVTHNWKPRYYKVMVSPIRNTGEEKRNFVIIVFYDITEMKLLENMRTDFIATISHEFKTPLTSIVIGADLLSNSNIGQINTSQKEIIDTMKEDGQQLSNLVNDLLELSKVESSDIFYQFGAISVGDAIVASMKHFKPRAKTRHINIVSSIDPGLPSIRGDFSKIVWILNNLMSNAFKYTPDGGTVEISATMKGENTIVVCVKDNGVGIPEEFLEKIFDKYVQVPGCDVETRGTGLGLAVARDIITAHKGKIWCESDVNRGSRFSFTLPVER